MVDPLGRVSRLAWAGLQTRLGGSPDPPGRVSRTAWAVSRRAWAGFGIVFYWCTKKVFNGNVLAVRCMYDAGSDSTARAHCYKIHEHVTKCPRQRTLVLCTAALASDKGIESKRCKSNAPKTGIGSNVVTRTRERDEDWSRQLKCDAMRCCVASAKI